MTEISTAQHAKDCRAYFENGCRCIASGALKKCDPGMPNWEAFAFYQQECTCSRNVPSVNGAEARMSNDSVDPLSGAGGFFRNL